MFVSKKNFAKGSLFVFTLDFKFSPTKKSSFVLIFGTYISVL